MEGLGGLGELLDQLAMLAMLAALVMQVHLVMQEVLAETALAVLGAFQVQVATVVA